MTTHAQTSPASRQVAADALAAMRRAVPAHLAEHLSRPVNPDGTRGEPTWRRAAHLDLISARLALAAGGHVKRQMIFMPPRMGKALAAETPIATPDGFTAIGDLRPGDLVFDETGAPTAVVATRRWQDRECAVVRASDGWEVVADHEHEWRVVLDRRHKCVSTRTTGELMRRASPRNPRTQPPGTLQLPDADLPVGPYMLGIWLGDGRSRDGGIYAGGEDGAFIRQRIRAEGYHGEYHADGVTLGVLNLKVPLAALGLIQDKHIPMQYLRASEAQRLALLQGLIDTDGYVAPDGCVEFCSTNRRLAEGCRQLVTTLGVKASLITGDATIGGRFISKKYRVRFYFRDAASLPRKRERTRNSEKRVGRYLTFREAEPRETVCIQVDAPSHMFLAGEGLMATCNSELVSHWFPVWLLNMDPRKRIILASYGQEFASEWGRRVRNTINENEAELRVKVADDSHAAHRWNTTLGGGMVATGAGGTLTGRGGDILIIDDPVKNSEEATSPTHRERVWNWYTSTARTRLQPGGSVVLMLTRWHADDLAGRLLEQQPGEWDVLSLPAVWESDEPDVLGRKRGDVIWPEQWSAEAMEETRREVDPHWWAALYQQSPVVAGGDLFRIADFRRYRIAPDGQVQIIAANTHTERAIGPGDATRFVTMDVAATTRTASDYTVLAVWDDVRDTRHLILRHVERVRVEGPELAPLVHRVMAEWQPAWVGVENVTFGLTLIQELQRDGVPVRKLQPDRDKVSRATAAAERVRSGHVVLPRQAEWLVDFQDEVARFPHAAHDDQVDVLAYAVRAQFEYQARPARISTGTGARIPGVGSVGRGR